VAHLRQLDAYRAGWAERRELDRADEKARRRYMEYADTRRERTLVL
jgi:hypothetical protein